jgi:uroporphyrinogen decarboxylase
MRQAGRYLPEYREVRSNAGSFLGLCYDPELASEVTLQPLRRFDLDAAILFSDILVVPHAMGLELSFVENEGPKLQKVCDEKSVTALGSGFGSWQFSQVYETVRLVRAQLKAEGAAFIGFCGAPWTVASYMIEGGTSDRRLALQAARENLRWFEMLMARLVESSIGYLLGQIEAGVEAVQIFDSWAGDVPEGMRQRVVHQPIAEIVAGVRARYPEFPVIVFGRGLADGHGALAVETKANCVGLEETARIGDVLSSLPGHCAVQGNLAPEAMSDGSFDLRQAVSNIVSVVPKHRHIFNLGHGIRPDADPARVSQLIAHVRQWDGDS